MGYSNESARGDVRRSFEAGGHRCFVIAPPDLHSFRHSLGKDDSPRLGIDARGICRPLPYPAWYITGLGTGPGRAGSTYASLPHARCAGSRSREPHLKPKIALIAPSLHIALSGS